MLPSTPLPSTPVVLSEAYGDTTPEPLDLVHETLGFIVQNYPEKIALVSRHQSRDLYEEIFKGGNTKGTDCLRWSYQLLQSATFRLLGAFQLHGIRKGMRVATFLNNGVEYLLAQWACFDLGCPFVPLSSRNLSNGPETIHMLKIAEVNAIIAADSQVANSLDELITGSGLSIPLRVCVAEQKSLSNWINFSTLLSPHVSYPSGRNVDVPRHGPEHIALIMFTSGTTTLPKACPHTHKLVIANIRGRIER
jgi:acyl-CoA synthetase (AMP-forming)/AMP-acid ligase II